MTDLPDDWTTWTDQALTEWRRAISDEQARRETIARIPDEIATLKERYIAGGGDPADLQ